MPSDSRYDKIARLHLIEHLLYQYPVTGLELSKLAEVCNVSLRGIQRDLKLIEESDLFPIWREKGKCGLATTRYMPPIRFEPSQALKLFLALRLMATYSYHKDPDVVTIFTKFNSVMKPPLNHEIEKTLEWINALPDKPKLTNILTRLAESWMGGHSAIIEYKSADAPESDKRTIDPYFIQPASAGHSCYVIAYCHKVKSMRTFKVERISSLSITNQTYEIPPGFNANEYLSTAWGITVGTPVVAVKLHIKRELVLYMEETTWHPSQQLTKQDDGSAIMTFKVNHTPELISWILGWGNQLEVLEPQELRSEIVQSVRATAKAYGIKG